MVKAPLVSTAPNWQAANFGKSSIRAAQQARNQVSSLRWDWNACRQSLRSALLIGLLPTAHASASCSVAWYCSFC